MTNTGLCRSLDAGLTLSPRLLAAPSRPSPDARAGGVARLNHVGRARAGTWTGRGAAVHIRRSARASVAGRGGQVRGRPTRPVLPLETTEVVSCTTKIKSLPPADRCGPPLSHGSNRPSPFHVKRGSRCGEGQPSSRRTAGWTAPGGSGNEQAPLIHGRRASVGHAFARERQEAPAPVPRETVTSSVAGRHAPK
jgi:hypothetical protein